MFGRYNVPFSLRQVSFEIPKGLPHVHVCSCVRVFVSLCNWWCLVLQLEQAGAEPVGEEPAGQAEPVHPRAGPARALGVMLAEACGQDEHPAPQRRVPAHVQG